jgi:hypothetical protein
MEAAAVLDDHHYQQMQMEWMMEPEARSGFWSPWDTTNASFSVDEGPRGDSSDVDHILDDDDDDDDDVMWMRSPQMPLLKPKSVDDLRESPSRERSRHRSASLSRLSSHLRSKAQLE